MTRSRKINYDNIYNYIVSYKQCHCGDSPGFRDIALECDISSTSVVSYILDALEQEGRIKLNSDARSIEVCGGRWIPPRMYRRRKYNPS